jgi:hypothetical protein
MTLLSAAALAGILATASTPTFELVEVQLADNTLHILALEHRAGRAQPLSVIGSVTTWRDLDGHEIRDRRTIEWLYTQWLAHKTMCV